jgi:hypothetical protein
MNLNININFDSEALFNDEDGSELEYCLLQVIKKMQEGREIGRIMDSNGNSVGQYKFEGYVD